MFIRFAGLDQNYMDINTYFLLNLILFVHHLCRP